MIKQCRQLDVIESGLGRIAVTNIDEDTDPGAIDPCIAFKTKSSIAGLIAYGVDFKTADVERDAVAGVDGADFRKQAKCELRVAVSKTKEIEIPRRAMRIVEPVPQQDGALQDKPVFVVADAESIKQALPRIF